MWNAEIFEEGGAGSVSHASGGFPEQSRFGAGGNGGRDTRGRGASGSAQWAEGDAERARFWRDGDGKTKDTLALQQTIDRCAVLGGGEVVVPAGDYATGALVLRSNVLLRDGGRREFARLRRYG